MEKEFIPYEQALALKELGFDEPCAGEHTEIDFYDYKGREGGVGLKVTKRICLSTINGVRNYNQEGRISAQTFSQAFRWFRQEHGLYSHVRESYAFDNTLEFVTQINGSYVNHGISDKPINRFETYEEAELECLKKLIEIAKEKQNAGTI